MRNVWISVDWQQRDICTYIYTLCINIPLGWQCVDLSRLTRWVLAVWIRSRPRGMSARCWCGLIYTAPLKIDFRPPPMICMRKSQFPSKNRSHPVRHVTCTPCGSYREWGRYIDTPPCKNTRWMCMTNLTGRGVWLAGARAVAAHVAAGGGVTCVSAQCSVGHRLHRPGRWLPAKLQPASAVRASTFTARISCSCVQSIIDFTRSVPVWMLIVSQYRFPHEGFY
jgi:hypothetical protein